MKRLNAPGALLLIAFGWLAACPFGAAVAAAGPDSTVRYVALTGSDGVNTCSDPAAPCLTIQQAVDRADAGDEVRVAAGAYTGVTAREGLNQTVYIDKSLTIRGGFSVSNWLEAKPETQPTVVNPQGAGRAFYITGGGSVSLEGLEITGGAASGLGGASSYDCGGGVFASKVDVTIANCRIHDNTGSTTGLLACGGGVYIGQQSRATLSGNMLIHNTANSFDTSGTGVGGGLGSFNAIALTVRDSIFEDNTGAMTGNGDGGGAYVSGCNDVGFERNTFDGNVAAKNGANTHGGGLALSTCDGARVEQNLFTHNTAGYGWAWGGGVYVQDSWEAVLSRNRIVDNIASNVYPVDSIGGGVAMTGADAATLVNNVVRDNYAGTSGSGIWLQAVSGSAVEADLLHNTVADNEGSSGIAADPGDLSLVMVNNIIAGHNTGITAGAGSTIDLKSTLWYANATGWTGAGTVTHSTDHNGDPRFSTDGYHLLTGSAAIDAGEDAGVAIDIDRQSRPYAAGYDIGADEAVRRWSYLPLAVK